MDSTQEKNLEKRKIIMKINDSKMMENKFSSQKKRMRRNCLSKYMKMKSRDCYEKNMSYMKYEFYNYEEMDLKTN